MTEDEMGALREDRDAGREEVREALAEDLGGAPEDYDAERYLSDRADSASE